MAAASLKYKKISELFLRDIRNGKYEPGKKLPSERELARQYNLAHMTVNKALNGLVSRGYLERRQGDGTYVRKSMPPKTACLVLDYMDDIHSIFPYKLQKALFEAGYIVTVFDTKRISKNREILASYLSNCPELLIVDGMDLFPFDLLAKVPKTTRKIIFQRNETKAVFDASYVLVDMKECGYMAAKQLIASGSKKITVIAEKHKQEYDQPSLFISGAMQAFNEYKIESSFIIEHEVYREQENARPVLETKAKELLRAAERPDGIMAFADYELVPFINAAGKLGLSIPEDLRLVGMYNTPWAEQYKLSSLDIQADLIIENIVDVIKSGRNKKVMVSPKIIFRQSSPQINK
jgi:GntR family transcriptional regulator of arabinose operon